MRRFISTLLIVILFLGNPHYTQAGSRSWSLSKDYIENVLQNSDRDIDLNRTILEITQRADRDLLRKDKKTAQFYELFLRELSAAAEDRINGEKDPQEVIKKLNDFLFNEKKFSVDRSRLFEGTLDNLILSQVLDNKKGNCLSLSLVYLLLAERLDLPINGVMIPGHFFVRYEDGMPINIETTARGSINSDEYYRKSFGRFIREEQELDSLNKKQVVAVYLANLANHYKLQGSHQKAIEILQNVAAVIPMRASVYVNLGNAHERNGDIFKAIVYYQKALSLDAYLCEAHYNLGLIHYMYTNMHAEAKRSGHIAQKLGCRLHPRFQAFLNERN